MPATAPFPALAYDFDTLVVLCVVYIVGDWRGCLCVIYDVIYYY